MIDTSPGLQTIREFAATVCGEQFIDDAAGIPVAAPVDALQTAELLIYAQQRGLAVCVMGSGSKLDWLNEGHCDLRMSTHRMNGVLEHTWEDMTCTVQAGCAWQNLQTQLAKHGQCIALDALWPDRATVGGVVAANDSGSLRLRYGSLRDLVIGMQVVLSDGTVSRSGGKVVKNVAGYDLPKLLTGSFGTLAAITEVTFRLHSLEQHTQTLSFLSTDEEAAGALLLRVLGSNYSTQSMQLRSTSGGLVLDIRLAGRPHVLASQARDIAVVAQSLGCEPTSSDDSVWEAREQVFAGPAGTIVFKASVLPSDLAWFAAEVVKLGGAFVAQATGIVTAGAPIHETNGLLSLRKAVENKRGSLVVLRNLPAGMDRWGALSDSLPLMRAVKDALDPEHVLNPKRFLGGI